MPFFGKGRKRVQANAEANARSNYIETSIMISLSQKYENGTICQRTCSAVFRDKIPKNAHHSLVL